MHYFGFSFAQSQTLRILALSLSYAVSLLIFQRGLLVKREVLPYKSSCADVNTKNVEYCWLTARYNKSILLIIDALRYDFIFPYKNQQPTTTNFFRGQMSNVAQLIREQPQNTVLFPFIADPPTTTFQRIKALVTGSIPAFIEAGNNFGGIEISEDNIVDQLLSSGRNATLIGDETWIQLLPGRFQRHFDEPSFDIKDLDTVDNSVIAHIFEEINRPDWSIMIAHCLGVDHAGHRYGPAHPEMRRKLLQMDQLIWNVSKHMSDDTILFVLGDHGMTESGDHGGDTELELMSAILAYEKRDGIFHSDSTINKSHTQVYHQVDLVPTLALLLDLPIPYSSIGKFMAPLIGTQHQMLQIIRLNSYQMLRYAQEYTKYRPELKDQMRQILREHESSLDNYVSNQQTITNVQKLIRISLDQFHFTVCLLGLLSLVDALIFNCYLLVITSTNDKLPSMCLCVFRSALLLLQLSLVLVQQHPSTDQLIFTFSSLFVSLAYQIPVFIIKLVNNISAQQCGACTYSYSLLFITLAQFILSLLPLSNSYIIYEADVLKFGIQTVLLMKILHLLHLYRISSVWRIPSDLMDLINYTFLSLITLRFLKYAETCREEQVACVLYKHSDEHLFLFSLAFTLYTIYFLSIKFWQAISVTKIIIWLMTLFLSLHWCLEMSAQSMFARNSPYIIQNTNQTSTSTTTITTLEFYSRLLAQIAYFANIFHYFAIRCWLYFKDNQNAGSFSLVKCQYQALIVPLLMLTGYSHGWSLASIILIFALFTEIFRLENIWTYVFSINLLGSYAFYATGQQQILSSIPWKAAFVGLPGNFPYKWLPGFLVLTRMFSGKLLASLILFSLKQSEGTTTMRATLYFLIFNGLKVLGSSCASFIHHKHLMFYKVFAPKFVFDSVEFLCSCAFILVWTLFLKVNKKF